MASLMGRRKKYQKLDRKGSNTGKHTEKIDLKNISNFLTG